MKSFEELLLQYGLVQFGSFADEKGEFIPFKLNLDWMVSYPEILRVAAHSVQEHFTIHDESISQFERILCPVDTLPVATLVSIETGIPVVYSRGRGEPAVQDLVGAYDINHPTLFLATEEKQNNNYDDLLKTAKRVGLIPRRGLCLFDRLDGAYSNAGVTGWLIDLRAISDLAEGQGYINNRQNQLVYAWIDKRDSD